MARPLRPLRPLRRDRGTALLTTTIMSFMIATAIAALLGQGVNQMRQLDEIESELARTYAAEAVLADVQFAALKSAYDASGNVWLRTPSGATAARDAAGVQIGWLWRSPQLLLGARSRLAAANLLAAPPTLNCGGVVARPDVPALPMGSRVVDASAFIELPSADGYFTVAGIGIYMGTQHNPITGISTLKERETRVTVEVGEKNQFSRYLWFISTGGVSVGSTQVHGLVHSNQKIDFWSGNAQMYDKVTSVNPFTFSGGASWANTTFFKGYDQKSPALPLPTSADVRELALKVESSAYNVSTTSPGYPSTAFNTEIQLAAGAGVVGTQIQLTLRSQSTGAILKTTTLPLPSNGLLYVGGPVTSLKGNLNGKLTIAGADKVDITGSLRYVDREGDPAYRLTNATGATLATTTPRGVNWRTAGYTYGPNPNYHDAAGGDTEPKSVLGIVATKDVTLTAACPYNLEMHGAVFSATGNWHADTSTVKGNMRILGSLTCATTPWAYSSPALGGYGVSRDYIYDDNLLGNPPKYFLAAKAPSFGGWRKNDKEGAWLWARR